MHIYMIGDQYRVDGVSGRFVEEPLDASLPIYEDVLELHTARNQYVSFQIVLDAREEGKIDAVEVSFTDFQGKHGALPADYEPFVEWFHTIGQQHIPDMLLPWGKVLPCRVPLSREYLPEQRVGAIWVDLFVDKAAKPGRYEGIVSVQADGVRKDLKILLRVHRCVTPTESLMIADLNNYADSISPEYPFLRDNPNRYRDGSYLKVERQFYRMAREHRCLFEHLNAPHCGIPPETFAPELEGAGKYIKVRSWEAFDEHFGPYLDGSAFAGSRRGAMPIEYLFTPFNLGWPADWSIWGKKGYTTEYRRILWEFLRHCEEKGWTDTNFVMMLNNKKEYRFFPTTQDEIWYRHDEEITRAFFDVIGDTYKHSHVKFLFRADESNNYHNHYNSEIGEHIDLWVANMTMFSWCPESVEPIKNRKSTLWHYGWFGEGMTLDLPLTAFFSHPMLGFMTGTTGFCSFWNAVGFGKDPYRTPFVDGGQALIYPGTGLPGADDVLPCIRLKALRNHMQLADLMMTSTGTHIETRPPVKAELQAIVNQHYGYANNKAWWREKPPFIEEEPRYWGKYSVDYSELTNAHHVGKSPMIIKGITEDVLRLMDHAIAW